MAEKLRILLLEDNASDAELIEHELRKDGMVFSLQRIETRSDFLKALKAFKPTLILADYSLPKFDALQALALRNKNAPLTPFIIVTGAISEEIAVECMKQGADDYLLKDRLARLGEAVRHSLTNHSLQVEKMATEESLRASELLYRTFIDSSPDMAFLKDSKFRLLLANQALCRYYEKPESEVIGKSDFELMEKSAATICRQTDEQVLAENSINIHEETIGGLTFETHKFPIPLADGRIGIGGYTRDISERKRTHEQIEQASRKWTATFDAIKDGIALLAVDQTIRQANQAFADLVNKPFKEIIGKKCYELMHPNWLPYSDGLFAKMQKSKKRESMELALDDRIFEVFLDPITNDAGELSGAAHIIIDITELKRTEQALCENQSRLLEAQHIGKIGSWEWFPAENKVVWSDEMYALFGLQRGQVELTPEATIQAFHPDDRPKLLEATRKTLEKKQPQDVEGRIMLPDGSVRHVFGHAEIMLDEEGQIIKLTGIYQDITERKQAEEALQESEEKYRLLVESANESIVIIQDGLLKFTNSRMTQMMGIPVEQLADRPFAALVHADDRAMVAEYHRRRLAGEKVPDQYNFRFLNKDGKVRWTEVKGVRIQWRGRPASLNFLSDITERKRTEEALRESEDRYRDLVENSQDLICTHNLEGKLLSVNEAAVRQTGYSHEELLRMNMEDLLMPPVRRFFKAYLAEIQKKGRARGMMWIQIASGEDRYWEYDNSLRTKDVAAPIVRSIAHDITERMRAEKQREVALTALRESEERFKAQYQGSPIAIFTWQKQEESFVLKEYNSSAEKITHGRVKEFVGKNANDMYGNRPEIMRALRQCFDKKGVIAIETTSEHFIPDKLVSATFAFIPPDLVMVHLEDITERKRAEDSIKNAELHFRTLAENSPDLIARFDRQFRYLYVNQMAATAGKYSSKKYIGKTIEGAGVPSQEAIKWEEHIRMAFKTGQIIGIEDFFETPNGRRYFNTKFVPERASDGSIQSVQSIARDITERRQAEDQIKASLVEKEILLKEIHHRVKNNLQIISGLLTLQAAQINDERLQKIIKESQSRIWTMALIHQTLYQSGNLADIDMADYIRSLAGNLLSLHAQVAMPPAISFDLLPIRLAIDKAIPLALIINELVTNSMKYAFLDGRLGEIRIALQERRGTARRAPTDHDHTPMDKENAPTYELTVTDNGTGLPAGFDPKNQKSLGLQLVTMLTKQLTGSLAIESKDGTSIRITFNANEKNEKQS